MAIRYALSLLAAAFVIGGGTDGYSASPRPARAAGAAERSLSDRVKAGPLQFEERSIMSGYAYPCGIAATDLDGDGDVDLTSADATPHNRLYWFENDGSGNFCRHLVHKDEPERLEMQEIADIDGDGHKDVVIVENLYGHLFWFRNSGNPSNGSLWSRHLIAYRNMPGAYMPAVRDFDADGDLDVAVTGWATGKEIAWFENDGSPENGLWEKRTIEEGLAEVRYVAAGDLNGDGRPDLVSTDAKVPHVVWYENIGASDQVSWRKHVVDGMSPAPMHGSLSDLDEDGDIDIVLAFGAVAADARSGSCAWYENKQQGAMWIKHEISRDLAKATFAVTADLDRDHDLDVIVTCWRNPGRLLWLENTGSPRQGWRGPHIIKDDWSGANLVLVADLDGDGWQDIAATAERPVLEFRWWRNLGGEAGIRR